MLAEWLRTYAGSSLTFNLVQICMNAIENLSEVNLRGIEEHHHGARGRDLVR